MASVFSKASLHQVMDMDDMLLDSLEECQTQLLLGESEDEDDDLLCNEFWPCDDYLIDDNDSDDDMLLQYFEHEAQDLLSTEPIVDSTTSVTTVRQIENVFEAIADAILAKDSSDLILSIALRPRANANSSSQSPNPRSGTTISFPGKTSAEAWRFSQQS